MGVYSKLMVPLNSVYINSTYKQQDIFTNIYYAFLTASIFKDSGCYDDCNVLIHLHQSELLDSLRFTTSQSSCICVWVSGCVHTCMQKVTLLTCLCATSLCFLYCIYLYVQHLELDWCSGMAFRTHYHHFQYFISNV